MPVSSQAIVLADLDEPEQVSFRAALRAADEGLWSEARRRVKSIYSPLPAKMIEWRYLLESEDAIPVSRFQDFISRNPNWPSFRQLRIRLEDSINDPVDHKALAAYFDRLPPLTTRGEIRYAEALIDQGRPEDARSWIKKAWADGRFSAIDQKRFLERHGEFLVTADHFTRADTLLWGRRQTEASRIIDLLEGGQRRLIQARLALQTDAGNIDAAVTSVPSSLSDDPGLMYDRAKWRERRGRIEGVAEILNQVKVDNKHAAAWWSLRQEQVRDALDRGDYRTAYKLAGGHRQSSGGGYADAEWLAGWISLRFLSDPMTALRHFQNLYEGVSRPISLARGAYWAGRAGEAMESKPLMDLWYRRAARWHTAFYGQLAAERYSAVEPDFAVERPSERQRDLFSKFELVQMIGQLATAGEAQRTRPFFLRLSDDAIEPTEFALVIELADDVDRDDMVVRLGKRASFRGLLLLEALFPIPGLPSFQDPPTTSAELALVLAIGRQESEFNPAAVSPAGARGMLQLMLPTAKETAKRLGYSYNKDRLIDDPDYNVRLGGHYIKRQIARFDGDLVPAIAAYNAGPGRVGQWIERFGDPRLMDREERIDWIERIPFSETRNYVQRVMESRNAYRVRLGQPIEIGLEVASAP